MTHAQIEALKALERLAARGATTGGQQSSRTASEGRGTPRVTPEKQRRGFAVMTPAQRSTIARLGGKAAHQKGTAHQWTSAEAIDAGRKGGTISRGGRGRAPADA